MAYVKVEDMTIAIFDGSDYTNWKRRILKLLEYKKCKQVAVRVGDATKEKEEDWSELNIKAVNDIYASIINKQLEYIADLDSALEIMSKFDQMYLKKSTALQIVRRDNLENVKLGNFSEVETFFDEFEKAVNELKAAGAEFSEQEKLRYMIKALPKAYSYIGDLMDVLKEEERTVDFLKSKKTDERSDRTKEVPLQGLDIP